MVLTHTCSKCQTTMTVPERFGGRQLKCLECGHPFQMEEDPVLTAPAPAGGAPARTFGSQVHDGTSRGHRGALWVVAAIALLVVVWMNRYRYDNVQLGDGSRIPIRENRLTSTTEMFYGGRWTTSLPPGSTSGAMPEMAPSTSTSVATDVPGHAVGDDARSESSTNTSGPEELLRTPTPEPSRTDGSSQASGATTARPLGHDPGTHAPEVLISRFDTEAYKNQRRQEQAAEARRVAEVNRREAEAKEAKEAEEKQRQASENKRRALADCLANAEREYWRRWNDTCYSYGLRDNCMLPSDTSAVYSHDRAAAQAECHRIYDVVRK